MVNCLLRISVIRLHHDGLHACPLHTEGDGQRSHVGHIRLVRAERLDDGVVIARLNFLHLAAKRRAQLLCQTVSRIRALLGGLVGRIGNGENAVLSAGTGGLFFCIRATGTGGFCRHL